MWIIICILTGTDKVTGVAGPYNTKDEAQNDIKELDDNSGEFSFVVYQLQSLRGVS